MDRKTKRKYLENKGVICPYCDNSDLHGDSFDAEANEVFQRIHCPKCGNEWEDVYTLTDACEV